MENIEKRINTMPTGGFPPIYICNSDKIKLAEDDNKVRGFSKDNLKIVASLKDIMEERRAEKTPFIVL